MTDQHDQGEREAFEAHMDRTQPPYWRTTAHAREAWALWQAARATAPSDRAAYEGCREDLLDWKRRALKAEDSLRESEKTCDNLTRALASEVNRPTFMGEPVATAPRVRETLAELVAAYSGLVSTIGSPEATAANERDAETRFERAVAAARAVLAAAGKEKP
jgi:hypothetical protein